VHNSY
jgi:hypothetical protein